MEFSHDLVAQVSETIQSVRVAFSDRIYVDIT